MSITSGIMLIYGPLLSIGAMQYNGVSIYFISYLMISLIINIISGKLVDKFGAKINMVFASLFRIMLFLLLVIHSYSNNSFSIIGLITVAAFASTADSFFRISSSRYLKEFLHNGYEKINGFYIVIRESGYIIGTSIGGFLLSINKYLINNLLLITAAITLFGALMIKNIANSSQQSVIIKTNIKCKNDIYRSNYIKVLTISVVGRVIPLLTAALIIEKNRFDSIYLGYSETAYALASILGALIYTKYKISEKPFLVLMIITLCFIPLTQSPLFIIFLFFLLGLGMQVYIPISTEFIKQIPKHYIGTIVSKNMNLANIITILPVLILPYLGKYNLLIIYYSLAVAVALLITPNFMRKG